MKTSYKKYFTKVALIWAGSFLLFLSVHVLVLAPQEKSRKQIEQQVAEKQRMYESALRASGEDARVNLNEQIEHLRDKLGDFVLEDAGNLTFDISQIAGKKKINPPTIKGKGRRQNLTGSELENIQENHIQINFTASFNQFASFLNALERHRPVVFVDSFKITRAMRNTTDHQVEMELTVFVKRRQDS